MDKMKFVVAYRNGSVKVEETIRFFETASGWQMVNTITIGSHTRTTDESFKYQTPFDRMKIKCDVKKRWHPDVICKMVKF